MKKEITLIAPDDWHLHLRDGTILDSVLPETTKHFQRALIMPNLQPPIRTSADVLSYKSRIEKAIPHGIQFTPKMTLYLTEQTDLADLETAFKAKLIAAVKLYPAGSTTNSALGVTNFDKVQHIFEKMAEIGCPLCIHGEVTDPEVDIFDREVVFIDKVLDPIRQKYPKLKIVMEHITTQESISYINAHPSEIAATITVHHLYINRNDMLVGGVKPHYYCLPIAKREKHRLALRKAATSGKNQFFLGTDSAPHLATSKESDCGCAGCFTAPIALPLLAQVFDEENQLDNLEKFVSLNGTKFYGVSPNNKKLTLKRFKFGVTTPEFLKTPEGPIKIFNPDKPIYWRVCH